MIGRNTVKVEINIQRIEYWDWVKAIYVWDYGYSSELAKLVNSQNIPEQYREYIAGILEGKNKPNNHGRTKLKKNPSEWVQIYFTIYEQLLVVKEGKAEYIYYQKPSAAQMTKIMLEPKAEIISSIAREHDECYNTIKIGFGKFLMKLNKYQSM